MANFNKLILVGRLTRDPESRTFNNGGMVANFGLAVTNRKKDSQGQWVDDPMFIDCAAFNRGESGKLANVVMEYTKKGDQILIEGKLLLETWEDKNNPGQKRSKHKIVVDIVQLLEPKKDGGDGNGTNTGRRENNAGQPPPRRGGGSNGYSSPAPETGDDGDIPF